MVKHLASIKFILFYLLIFSSYAHADMTLVYKTPDGKTPFKVMVSGNKAKFINNNGSVATIIDIEKGYVSTVMHEQKMVMKMDKKSSQRLSQLRAQASNSGAMDLAMNLLPHEYRIAIDLTVKAALGIMKMYIDSIAPNAVAINDTGKTRKINGKKCQIWETVADNELYTISCLASAKDLGISQADEDRARAAIFYSIVLAQDIALQNMPLAVKVSVKMNHVRGTAIEMDQKKYNLGIWTLTEANANPIPAKQFTIPAGYTVMEL